MAKKRTKKQKIKARLRQVEVKKKVQKINQVYEVDKPDEIEDNDEKRLIAKDWIRTLWVAGLLLGILLVLAKLWPGG